MTQLVLSPEERDLNAAMLLTLWARCASEPLEDAGDRPWQMKLAYLAARELHAAELGGLRLQFYRWRWGPMANEVYDAWGRLQGADLLVDDERLYVTERGADLADTFYREVLRDERNAPIREVIDAVTAHWGGRPDTARILDHVYRQQVDSGNGTRAAIESLELGWPILEPADAPSRDLFVDPGWEDTLAILFDRQAIENIDAAGDDFRAGRIHAA